MIGTASCGSQGKKEDANNQKETGIVAFSDSARIVGKRLRIIYPDFTIFESFKSDTTMMWTSVNIDGDRDEGEEMLTYCIVEENIHYIGWITKEGEVISQVLDMKEMKAYSIINQFNANKSVSRKGKLLVGVIKYME